MIGLLHQMQGRHAPQPFDNRLQQTQFRERVARPLQEQHGDTDSGEMFGPVAGRLAGRMQGKAQKRQAANAGQGGKRLRLRRHPSAERFAAREQWQSFAISSGLRHRGTYRAVCDRGRIRPLAAALHIGKLVAQRCNAALAEAGCDRLHRRMGHAGARPVCEHVSCARPRGPDQQRGDRRCVGDRDFDSDRLRGGGFHLTLPECICISGTVPQTAAIPSDPGDCRAAGQARPGRDCDPGRPASVSLTSRDRSQEIPLQSHLLDERLLIRQSALE